MKYITSVKNPKVKQWKKLLSRKGRETSGAFLIEGFHLVEEAVKGNAAVQEIMISETTEMPPNLDFGSVPVYTVTGEIAEMLAETETTQGIFAVCEIPKASEVSGSTFLLVDAVQDPGNLGTMIRTADAAGVDAVIVGTGSVDIYNPKVLRSAQGSTFHLPVISENLAQTINRLSEWGIPVYGTALENGQPYNEVELGKKFALIVGNEGKGVDKELLSKTDRNLYIPILGSSESLNVAVAAGILLYYLKLPK
ncbi:TrmH family RNA methyltransferase [Bacillus massilinigeriensis]|uniref:TrmH family RNA methyltransferase n=1 Tax=Bacillus mediterraneensis TaxID=1805474 RepID=UPI0008F88D6A|nr:RNA methyltransferase [Bacillus mediterraneensis]